MFEQNRSIGIIGGGQLALMLASSAVRLGFKPIIFAKNSLEPAARVIPEAVFGSSEDPQALAYLLSRTSKILMENEFQNCQSLSKAASISRIHGEFSAKPTEFFPNLEAIELLQDKLNQKNILKQLEIPTAEFMPIHEIVDLNPLVKKWNGRAVLKWSKMGYDGKGVFFIDASQPKPAEDQKVIAFCQEAKTQGGIVYAEQAISFRRELALVAVRSVRGDFISYPLVITEQEKGICSQVMGPALSLGVHPKNQELATQYAKKIAEKTHLVGTFAIEFFETPDGEILVNEIAPRVHNSGHYTQDASDTDQFENHLRAVLGLPLGSVSCRPGFVMVNFLGPSKVILKENKFPLPQPPAQAHLHWYHKAEVRPGRKMGHLNGTVESAEQIPMLRKDLEEIRRNWIKDLHGLNHYGQ